MVSKFSDDGKYFAQISADGKLKLWNTESNSLEQEFTPDFHLTSPCTCLHFVQSDAITNKGTSPRKKKRRNSISNNFEPYVVLGTTSGLLLAYSISRADVEFTINSQTSQSISCLTLADGGILYSGADQNILTWSLSQKCIKSKWKTGNEKVTSVTAIPDSNTLLSASKQIKLWDVSTKEVLKTFTGHSSDIVFLQYVRPTENSDAYCISGSRGDRILSCWNLNESAKDKNAVAGFLMEDIIQNVSINVASNGSTNMAATVRSGVVHVYHHTLNGKSSKPLKPKTTIQVVSDTGQNSELVTPIHIAGAFYRDDETLCIGHGSAVVLTFENVTISYSKKVQCLIRKDPRTVVHKENDTTKSRTLEAKVSNDVNYVTPQTSNVIPRKRKNDGMHEIPMEMRLENLTLNKADNSVMPTVDNVAHLLVQGLHSKDKSIIRAALLKQDENVIRNTVKRLPMTVIKPLIEELTIFLQGKTLSGQIGSLWLKHILQIHSGILISNPELSQLLSPTLASIESRLVLQTPLNRLKGRLDLLVSQISTSSSKETSENEEPLLVFNDKDSSDSENEDVALELTQSESDNEWEEENSGMEEENSGMEENHIEDVASESDENMSS